MEESKAWYMSKGIWGSVIVVILLLLRLFGYEEMAAVLEPESVGITERILDGVAIFGAGLALYGRVTADKVIE